MSQRGTPRPPPPPRRREDSPRNQRQDRRQQDPYGSPNHARTRSRSPYTERRQQKQDTPGSSSNMNSQGWPKDQPFPKEWTMNEDHWDINENYKMTLPKRVVSNAFSKKNNTENVNIMTLPLYKVLRNGPMDYGMRLVANARFVKFEPMKSLKESFIIGQILWRMRARDKNNASLPVIDIDGIAIEIAKTKKLPFGTNEEKKKIYNIIADTMADAVHKMNPVHEQSKMLKELEILKKENARLKATTSTHTATQAKPKAKIQARLAQPVLPSVDEEEDPPYSEDEQPAEVENIDDDGQNQEPDDQEDPLINFRRGQHQERYLGQNAPTAATKTALKAWYTKGNFKLTEAKWKMAQKHASSLQEELYQLGEDDQQEIPRIAIDWGLPVQTTAKLSLTDLTRIIGFAQYLTK